MIVDTPALSAPATAIKIASGLLSAGTRSGVAEVEAVSGMASGWSEGRR